MTGPAALPDAGVPPAEAIAFFRAKGFRIGFAWEDVFRSEHARWFTVAKAMSRDILQDIREAVDAAIADGTTLEQFKKDLRPKLEARGWWGRKRMIDPLTGAAKTVQLGSPRRLRIIFNTNVRTAYAAGKWQRIQRVKAAFPYLEYSSVMDGREREEHHNWHGTILPVDHPWWDNHYPPCDWECRCDAIPRTKRMLARQGKAADDAPPPPNPSYTWTNSRTGETGELERGIGKGWDYNVGKEYLRGLAPSPLPDGFDGDEVGAAVQFTADQAGRVDRFLAAFGIAAGGEAIWRDRDGWPLSIGRGWFIGRNRDLRLPANNVLIDRIAAAIVTPDAIDWVWMDGLDGRAMLMRRYVRAVAGIAMIVEIGAAGWWWRVVRAAELADDTVGAGYNPYQAREPKGSRKGGQFRSTGTAKFLASLDRPAPGGTGLHRIGDASPSAVALIEKLGIAVRSPAVWLEHGAARHILKRHGGDDRPVTKQQLARVHLRLNRALDIQPGARPGWTGAKTVRVAWGKRDKTVAVFEVRRRGLVLQTMHHRGKRKQVSPS
jgi:SPP1 gp7 family putative phage head morphogenesis protein